MKTIRALIAAIFLAGLGLPASTSAKEMTFDVIHNNHTNIIVGDGDITSGTPTRFPASMKSFDHL